MFLASEPLPVPQPQLLFRLVGMAALISAIVVVLIILWARRR